MKNIRESVGQVDVEWLRDNISQKVDDKTSTLFWLDPWLDGMPLKDIFGRLYELADYKLETVEHMFAMWLRVNGEAWK